MTEPIDPQDSALTPGAGASTPTATDALLQALRARTPARILEGRCGPAYPTATWLQLREDHAVARDAVEAELDLERDLGPEVVARWQLFEVQTLAASKEQYLLRPDLGRSLTTAAQQLILERCPRAIDVQLVIGDGLSVAAVRTQVPRLLPRLVEELRNLGLTVGQPLVVRHCRVGVLNEVGALLGASVVVLLIGERPGLATAESLSAYLAYDPRPGDTDARRNLIANIHDRGIPVEQAARRIAAFCRKLDEAHQSGVGIKEDRLPAVLRE
jgi:ethanolamine ammonia-lyase small subunit